MKKGNSLLTQSSKASLIRERRSTIDRGSTLVIGDTGLQQQTITNYPCSCHNTAIRLIPIWGKLQMHRENNMNRNKQIKYILLNTYNHGQNN